MWNEKTLVSYNIIQHWQVAADGLFYYFNYRRLYGRAKNLRAANSYSNSVLDTSNTHHQTISAGSSLPLLSLYRSIHREIRDAQMVIY